ncbi:MAG: xanthine dehydrogenase family protein molybdopterin-binding subunit, partial [Chloroflexi bacterium]|nr:xanthine dehydrogenase family protein molybdopterin-binding subunit [Chloroflexota bacterium]
MASNIVLSNTEYKVVGTRPIRHDGTDKVTGRAKYGGDFQAAGLLHGKVLRSPHAHARIKSIDVSRALAYPGVKAVITGEDMPVNKMESPGRTTKFASDNLMARDKVLYRGHAVAAVAAVNAHVAESAIALIDVQYEVLPPLMNVREAMKDGAAPIHQDVTTTELGERTDKVSNVATHFRFEQGDADKGFEEADVIVEREFSTATVHQGYIEPQNASALWDADGQLTIWTSTQGSFSAREALADVLATPVSKIKVVPMEIGGGFGGKIPIYLEPLAALLSRNTGQSVKMIMSRDEVFECTGPTSGTYIKVKMGATRSGKITAAEAYLAYESGAFPGSMVSAGGQCMFAPYEIDNVRVDGYDVVVNKPKTAAYRAPAAPNAAFAGEAVVDEICQALGMDPIEFRLLNASKEGTRRVDGPVFPIVGNIECLEAARDTA